MHDLTLCEGAVALAAVFLHAGPAQEGAGQGQGQVVVVVGGPLAPREGCVYSITVPCRRLLNIQIASAANIYLC